jgi:hypothetical protein
MPSTSDIDAGSASAINWRGKGASMSELKLTDEQARVVTQAPGPVQVYDNSGNLLGHFEPVWKPEFIAELKRRGAAPGPFFTGAQVQARLRALQEEWDRTGGFDHVYMKAFLAKLDAADPGHMRGKGSGK